MWRAETRFDPDYLERVLHPDFFEFGRSCHLAACAYMRRVR